MKLKGNVRNYIMALFVVFVWSVTFISTKVLLRWLLHLCRNFSAEDVGNAPQSMESARLFFTEGHRMVGMRLMRLLQQANPGHLPALLQTKENDAHDLSTF